MNQSSYKPRVTRLTPPKKPRWKLRIVVALTFVTLSLVLVDAIYDGPVRQVYTRAPVLSRFVLPNGETLVVHAVLGGSKLSTSFRGIEIGTNDGQVTLVMSCKNEHTGRLSDWSWLKHIEVEDRYGAVVEMAISDVIQKSQDTTHYLAGKFEKLDFLTADEVYCVVRMPKVEALKPTDYLVIDTNEDVVATIQSNLPPLQPSDGFYDHSHNLIAQNGPWKIEIEEMYAVWHPAHDAFASHFRIWPSKIYFDHKGSRVDNDNLVVLDEQLTNALGSSADKYPQLNHQPLWKYSSKVARSDYLTTRQDTDLKRLGRIEDLKTASEVSSPEGLRQVRSFTFVPTGKYETAIADVSGTKFGSIAFSNRQTRAWKFTHNGSGSGGGGRTGYTYEYSSIFSIARDADVLDIKIVTQSNQPTQLSMDTKRPLVMFQLEETSNDHLINLFAFDQLNRALQVDAVTEWVDKLPTFLIDTDSDTEYLDLYYSIEPIVPVETYIIPPTKGLVFPETGLTWYTLAGSRDGWLLKHVDKRND